MGATLLDSPGQSLTWTGSARTVVSTQSTWGLPCWIHQDRVLPGLDQPEQWYQRRVHGGYPAGFTRTESYLDWISQNTGINAEYMGATLLDSPGQSLTWTGSARTLAS